MPEIVPFEKWLRLRHQDAPGKTFSDTPGSEPPVDENLYYPMLEGQRPQQGDVFRQPLSGSMQDEMLAKIARGRMRDMYEAGHSPLAAMQQRQAQMQGMAGTAASGPKSLQDLMMFLKLMRGM